MEFERKYGTATTVYVPVIKAGSNNQALSADWTPAAGDVTVVKDGAAAANITTLPTAITMGNGAVWKFSLSATEMQAAEIVVNVADATTKAVEDQMFLLATYGNASAEHAFDRDTASVAQTGDNYARLGAPAGASIAADLVVIDNFVDELETRLTAARAGYLDNLSAGAVALASELTKVPKSDGTTTWNATALAQIVNGILNEAIAGHLTSGTVGLYLAVAGGVLVDTTLTGTPSSSTFTFTGGVNSPDFYQDKLAWIITGTGIGQAKPILTSSYSGGTTTLTFDETYDVVPVNGDRLIIQVAHIHPLTQLVNNIDSNSTQLAAIVADTNELQVAHSGGNLGVDVDKINGVTITGDGSATPFDVV